MNGKTIVGLNSNLLLPAQALHSLQDFSTYQICSLFVCIFDIFIPALDKP